MIELTSDEIEAVSDGNSTAPTIQAAAKACTGLPSSTRVIVTRSGGAQLGTSDRLTCSVSSHRPSKSERTVSAAKQPVSAAAIPRFAGTQRRGP
jgi:hypothetical protein